MADLIDRQTAIETAIEAADKWDGGYSSEREGIIRKFFDKVPAVQPDHIAESGKKVERTDESAQNVSNGDLIYRKAAIDAINKLEYPSSLVDVKRIIVELPSVQPEIIRCRNCKFASGDSRICMKFDHSPIGELDFCAWAERRTDG